ncbi:MAG: hypothetical protein QM539_06165 [Alphaproteobacteria bacterium]|nr:hypothetical protein [Alphaproteobacteria bacterium]
MLAPLSNEVVFKMAFTDKLVLKSFIKDLYDIDFNPAKIETEKSFKDAKGNIKFKLDIFAEDTKNRIIVEIQRIPYDYHFDRFLGNFLNTITQQQNLSSNKYKINKKVFSVIILTSPYKYNQEESMYIEDEVLLQDLDPENLGKQKIKIFGHKQLFLNPFYSKPTTPKKYRDWLDLIYQSIKNPENYIVNTHNKGIKKVVHIIDYAHIDFETSERIKIAEETLVREKIVETVHKREIEEVYKKLEEKDKTIEEKDKAIKNSILALSEYIKDHKIIASKLNVAIKFVIEVLKK